MVHSVHPCQESTLESMATHCRTTEDEFLYLPFTFAWGHLVEFLDQYDGNWREAVRIHIYWRGVVLTTKDGKVEVFKWSHFGLDFPDTP
jgi:hypothetical protein